MKTLIYGAGPLGSLYTHRLYQAGKDVTLLARGQRFEFIKKNGLVLVDGHTKTRECSKVKVTEGLGKEDQYDLVIVLIRKNKLESVFPVLAENAGLENILFMGNNALGFDEYSRYLPPQKTLFGFPAAGGGIRDQVVHYVDREKAGGKRRATILGEVEGKETKRTDAIKSLFETSGVPACLPHNIDGWLKYHVAMVSPLGNALYKFDCDCRALAKDKAMLRTTLRAVIEGGRVLKALGYRKREPFQFNLFYWLPEFLNIKALQKLLESKFAEIAFGLHARAARDEMQALSLEFESLARATNIETPNIDRLRELIM